MPYALDDHGRPIFLISTMAMHTQNLRADPRASLLVMHLKAGDDVLGASRVTLVGDVLPLKEPAEMAEARTLYLASYENSKYWVDFEDFSFYRMKVVDVYYVGRLWCDGLGGCGRLRPREARSFVRRCCWYRAAHECRQRRARYSCQRSAGIETQEVEMTSVDRLGFHIRAKTQDGMRGACIEFLRESAIQQRPGRLWSKWFNGRVNNRVTMKLPGLTVRGHASAQAQHPHSIPPPDADGRGHRHYHHTPPPYNSPNHVTEVAAPVPAEAADPDRSHLHSVAEKKEPCCSYFHSPAEMKEPCCSYFRSPAEMKGPCCSYFR